MIDTQHGRFRWTIIALLFSATTINYLDRQILSLLQPVLAETYSWTNADYANIASTFQIAYALSMLFVGRIVDKMGIKSSYAWAIIIWSAGAMLHAFALPLGDAGLALLSWMDMAIVSASVLGFMISRAVLAFGESANFPVAIKVTAEYFPRKERSIATGIFNSGANIGAILAPLTVPFIAYHWGWQMAFLLIGGIGFIWLFFWLIYYEKPEKQTRISAAELAFIRSDQEMQDDSVPTKQSWLKLLGYRQTWAFVLGKFLTDGVWWFFLFWLPAYLKAQYNMTGPEIAFPLGVIYTLTMFGSIGGGWFPVYFIKNDTPAYEGRLRAMFWIALFPLVVLMAQPLGGISHWMPVLLIGIGAAAHQAWSANLFTTVSDLFPLKMVGTVVGIGGMAGGLGGVLTSKLGGALFDHYQALGHIQTGYTIMFAFCATAYLAAWILIKILVPKYRAVNNPEIWG